VAVARSKLEREPPVVEKEKPKRPKKKQVKRVARARPEPKAEPKAESKKEKPEKLEKGTLIDPFAE
jgi:hypothetical protein